VWKIVAVLGTESEMWPGYGTETSMGM
jgi:hypothetical protein